MLERLPFYGQVVVFLALGCAVLGIAWYVYPGLADKREEIRQLEDEYAAKDQKITEGRAIEQRLPQFEREIANLERKLADVQQILPTNQETGELLSWIKNLGDQSNLDLKSFNPGSLKPVEFYKEFPIEMNVIGGYHDLGRFLDQVSKYSRIINVDKLKIDQARGERDKTIRASFTATTFVYDDAAAAAAATQEGAQ